MSLNECESEAECEEKRAIKNEPETSVAHQGSGNSENSEDSKTENHEKLSYPSEYGFQISTAADLNFCFHKYGKNCKIFLAVKFDSILEATHSTVIVESLNVGCRLINNGPEAGGGDRKWDKTACQAMKTSTPESIHCHCESKSSFR